MNGIEWSNFAFLLDGNVWKLAGLAVLAFIVPRVISWFHRLREWK